MSEAITELGRKLNYLFVDPTLLERALTHRSRGADNNERLEFLGDSLLNFVVAAELCERYPDLTEGELTRVRASLVKKETLAEVARELDLGHFLKLGEGENKSGGHERDSILADALEAIFGAVYQDGGFIPGQTVVRNLYQSLFAQLNPRSEWKDAKTRLQEILQKQGLSLPIYNILEVSGESHAQLFIVECRLPGRLERITGQGSSRRRAEQEAATKALEVLSAL